MNTRQVFGILCQYVATVVAMLAIAGIVVADETDFNAMLLEIDQQLKTADYAGALANVERAEALLKDSSNPEVVVNLFVRHAYALMALDDYHEARRKLFDGLEFVDGRKDGISPDYEFALRDMLLEFAKQAQEYDHGNRAAKNAIKARQRLLGKNNEAMVAARMNAARWYLYSSQFARAAKECEKAIAIVEGVAGANSPDLYKPLFLLANSHMAGSRKPQRIREALNRTLTLEYQDQSEGEIVRSEALARLGDMEVVFFESANSTEYYKRAWQARKKALQGNEIEANKTFASPKQLKYTMPRMPARSSRGAEYFGEGYVVSDFTVTAEGTVASATVFDSRPGNDFDLYAIKAIKRAKYRPRVWNGEPVETQGVKFKQTYSYED